MKKEARKQSAVERAEEVFKKHGGMMKTTDALSSGIHPETLYSLLEAGRVEKLSRGLYRLTGSPPLGDPDLIVVAKRIPRGVICLVSALFFHELTTQIPHKVQIALRFGTAKPRLNFPPIETFHFSGKAFTAGVETHELEDVPIKVFGPEKTLADCVKFRNRIGMETVVEALRLYRDRKPVKVDELMRFASICRVERIIRPYLEAVL